MPLVSLKTPQNWPKIKNCLLLLNNQAVKWGNLKIFTRNNNFHCVDKIPGINKFAIIPFEKLPFQKTISPKNLWIRPVFKIPFMELGDRRIYSFTFFDKLFNTLFSINGLVFKAMAFVMPIWHYLHFPIPLVLKSILRP